MNGMVQEIINDGGEGIILRKVNSLYEYGRTSSLIKLKVVFISSLFSLLMINSSEWQW
jgi:ATP-dependent DNA ligase